MRIPLEDNFTDILGKAQRGLRVSDSELASKAALDIETVQRLRAGDFENATAGRLAAALGLNARALVDIGEKIWQPRDVALDGLAMFNTPFDDMTVNAYVVWDAEAREAAAFDTGSDCGPMLQLLEKEKLTLKFIFLTHTHGDHVFDIDRLRTKTEAPAYVSRREPLEGAEAIDEGARFHLGKLTIETRLTWGHSRGGMTYVVRGLTQPVAIVGDAIFAGSMGGGMVSYADALRTNREQILTLPDETILCPGHGPMTTVGEEKKHNPFFAE